MLSLLASSIVLCVASAPAAPPAANIRVAADERGVWAFVTPDNKRILSLGINNVSPEPFQPRPGTDYYNPVPTQFKGDKSAWAKSVRELLLAHNFNTAGSWSDASVPAGDGLYHTPILYVGGTDFHHCLDALRPDFAQRVKATTAKVMAAYPDRSQVIGVFLDNEMPWWGKSGWDRIPNFTLLERVMEEPATEPARVAAIEFLKGRYKSPKDLADAYGQPLSDWSALSGPLLRQARGPAIDKDRSDFTALVADKFYKLACEGVREVIPGVLILGSRFAGDVPDPVIVACGKYCDVISFNDYHGDPTAPDELIARNWVLGKKPLMITEYAWRAAENSSGCPNTAGAGAVIPTQKDRAERYAKYLDACLQSSVIIGLHWFEFADQSPQGRFDGENSNYGIVDIKNRPYTAVLESMKKANGGALALRTGSLKPAPTEIPRPAVVTYAPGQHPGRPPALDLIADAPTREPEIWGAPDSKVTYVRDGKAFVFTYAAGSTYGGGINLYGPAKSRCPSGPAEATDLDGYKDIVLDLTAPKGVQLNIVLTEAGAGPVGQATYVSPAGDDGEAFISDAFFGEGARHAYRIPIAALKRQTFWGNQAGKNVIQMSAVRCIGLQIQGSPNVGAATMHEFRLER